MRWIILLACVAMLPGCSSKRGPSVVDPAFYYWSTRYAYPTADSVFLKEAGCRKIYVRFFDVGFEDSWTQSGEIVPKGRLKNDTAFRKNLRYVPVIYIENDVFKVSKTAEEHKWLSSKITTKLFRMARNNGLPEERIHELQVDCDWTEKTRDTYFAFLKTFRKLCGNRKLSVTLRLHQYKYRDRSGVPPADRCMLMYYNMSNLKDFSTKNYILDNEEGKKYIAGVEPYPLPLDMALPVYSQGVQWYAADSSFSGLTGLRLEEARQQNLLWEDKNKSALYVREQRDSYYFTRFEYVSPENLSGAATVLQEAVNTDTFTVSFFELNETYYKNIGHEKIRQVIRQFGGAR